MEPLLLEAPAPILPPPPVGPQAPAPTSPPPNDGSRRHPTWKPGQPSFSMICPLRRPRLGKMSHNELRRVVRTQAEQLTALQTVITKLEDRLQHLRNQLPADVPPLTPPAEEQLPLRVPPLTPQPGVAP